VVTSARLLHLVLLADVDKSDRNMRNTGNQDLTEEDRGDKHAAYTFKVLSNLVTCDVVFDHSFAMHGGLLLSNRFGFYQAGLHR